MVFNGIQWYSMVFEWYFFVRGASEHDRRQGFGAHDRAGLRHATGGRASERDQVSAHTTGPGFGTPLAQLIPRRRIGLCRRFPRFLQLSPS